MAEKFVTLRPMRNKKSLAAEPEMKELKGLIDTGRLRPDKLKAYIGTEIEREEGMPRTTKDPRLRQLTVRLTESEYRRLQAIATLRGVTITDAFRTLIPKVEELLPGANPRIEEDEDEGVPTSSPNRSS